mmetsp:Transcript_15086/g.30632  ORF Transcript_15086/g.30632 Transcript_15086/m.30632 type:complete len:245 (+) Transcript_15086:75-809(+)
MDRTAGHRLDRGGSKVVDWAGGPSSRFLRPPTKEEGSGIPHSVSPHHLLKYKKRTKGDGFMVCAGNARHSITASIRQIRLRLIYHRRSSRFIKSASSSWAAVSVPVPDAFVIPGACVGAIPNRLPTSMLTPSNTSANTSSAALSISLPPSTDSRVSSIISCVISILAPSFSYILTFSITDLVPLPAFTFAIISPASPRTLETLACICMFVIWYPIPPRCAAVMESLLWASRLCTSCLANIRASF